MSIYKTKYKPVGGGRAKSVCHSGRVCAKCGESIKRVELYHFTSEGTVHWDCGSPTSCDKQHKEKITALNRIKELVVGYGVFKEGTSHPVAFAITMEGAQHEYVSKFGIKFRKSKIIEIRRCRWYNNTT